MAFKMVVESDDWNELHSTIQELGKTLEKYKKVLERVCIELEKNTEFKESMAYKEAKALI